MTTPQGPSDGATARGSSRARNLAVFGAKVAVAGALIGWLVRSGALDFGALRVMIDRPWLLAATLGLFLLSAIVATLRWAALLRIAGVRPPLPRLFQLQLTALFFNVVIPGNVGGDVVKALYVARDAPAEKRTTILLIVFVERLLGLGGLVTMATLVTALRGSALWADPLLRPLATTVAILGAATVLGPAVFLVVMNRAGSRLGGWTSGTTAIAKLLGRVVAALRLLSAGPRWLFAALGLSMAMHGITMSYFTVLTHVLTNQDVPYSAIATVFPLGLLTMILPISPSGLGVGHVAFDRLFAAIGLHGGATVFNVYLLGQIAPCLLGVFPYLALRKQGAVPTEPTEAPTA